MENSRYILDSFSMLCFFGDEPGAGEIQKLLGLAQDKKCQLFMSVINLSEVYYIVRRRSGLEKASQILALIESFPVKLEIVDRSLALQAGDIKSAAPIALADCFCAALAKKYSAIIVSGDPEFEKIEGEFQIKWLPQKR